jgi:Rod binding domain-containing protein
MLLTEAVSAPDVLPNVKGIEGASEEQKKKLARDFESLFIGKLLEEMDNTVVDWSGEEGQVFGQVKGIFNLYMSQHIGSSGGFGLWKQIYESVTQLEQKSEPGISIVDGQI